MAAAANKPGAVHYTLAVFVALAVILGITNFMAHREASDRMVEVARLNEENQKLNKAQRTLDDQLQATKQKLGIKLDLVDDPNNPQTPTVISTLGAEMLTYGGTSAGATVVDTLRKMREEANVTADDRQSKTNKVANLEAQELALKGQYQAQVENYLEQKTAAEAAKRDVISESDEKINAKVSEITRLNGELKSLKIQLDEERDGREKDRKDSHNTIVALESRIDIMRQRLDDAEKLSFETAKGLITRVEHTNNTVLINLGEEDFLRPRMTFSVYSKENPGVGRGPEDIKGKIEVIRILGPHLAEAKVVDEDLYRPMVSQDLIYTPIWSPGLVEKISVVGLIDLDQDGRSDREQFHQMLAVSGCVIDNEVNDEGERIPENGKITVNTRFLVKAEIPDMLDALTDAEKARATIYAEKYKMMEDEARKNGVRVVKLNDFLAYIGFHAKRRTFMPGSDRPYTLKSGGTSSISSGGSKDRVSNGNVSAVFKKGRQTPQETSNGNTSGASSGNNP
ncbi:hypothetical protein [Schlesneria paludicola]|uniref:hypothetical protein n=1 Tax=Schlesneria paludicola TaxID=360056 RepID=UPI00029B00F2|nr:hypothetical protein [Schlesneria paludicola]